MQEDNKSLIHISSSSLAKTDNLIKLTEKILEISKLDVRINLIPYRKGNSFQVYDYKAKLLNQNIFDNVYYLDKTLTFSKSCIIELNKKYSIINKIEDLENTTWYRSIKLLESNNYFNLSIIGLDNLFGIIDDKNIVILPIDFDEIKTFYFNSNTFVRLKKNNLFGFFHLESMKLVLDIEYDKIEKPGYEGDDNIINIFKQGLIGVFDLQNVCINIMGKFEGITTCNEGICTVKINDSWKLFNISKNLFINNSSYSQAGIMKNGFSLCRKNEQSFVVFIDGTEKLIGIEPEYYKRSGDILYNSETVDGHKLYFKLYLRDKFLSEFEIPFSSSRWLLFESLSDERIEIAEYWSKGNLASNVAVYSLMGDKIEDKPSYILRYISPGEINELQLSKTNWEIKNNNLYYKSEIVLKGDNSITELYADGFFSGVAKIIEYGSDFEFDSDTKIVGYIDINGNKYWED